jgi:hypothetical protein
VSKREREREREREEKGGERGGKIKFEQNSLSHLCTRVGAALASLTAIMPPMECPTRCADFQPTASCFFKRSRRKRAKEGKKRRGKKERSARSLMSAVSKGKEGLSLCRSFLRLS